MELQRNDNDIWFMFFNSQNCLEFKKKRSNPAKKHRNVQIPNKYKSIIKAGPKLGFEKLD